MYAHKFHKVFQKKRTIKEKLFYYFNKIPYTSTLLSLSKEYQLIIIFLIMFLILFFRLFYIQVIKHHTYNEKLLAQSTSLASVNSERWDIYAIDKTWQPVKLTENINLYDIALDPREIWISNWISMKHRFIEIITPVIYKHFCIINWMEEIKNREECIRNIESFTNIELIPKKPEIFYYWKEYDNEWNAHSVISPEFYTFDENAYNIEKQKAIEEITDDKIYELISKRLDEKIKQGKKEKNYVWYYTDENFLEDLKNQKFNFISIEANFYLYITPKESISQKEKLKFQSFMNNHWYKITTTMINNLFKEQEYKYIKLISSANPEIAQDIKNLQNKYSSERYEQNLNSPYKYPILHWIILEPYPTRYYPYWEFLSNVLWYVDKNWTAFYWIEKFYDEILKWKNWEISWRSSWNMGWNDFEVINTKDWDDIVLTIDIWIQQKIEHIAKKYLEKFKADSIAIMVYNPKQWQVKASVSLPTFNPNNYNDAYTIIPLTPEYDYILDNETYIDIPVYILSWWKYVTAKSDERKDTTLKKYLAKNIYWAQVFVNKNISTAFEPWSIFKSFTMAIWLDSDEVRLNDYYQDNWSLKIDRYTIKNASQNACMWYHTLLEALINSCNVWMIKIVQSIGKEIFYNYLTKLWFWENTWIELAEEKNGRLPQNNNVSMAAFFNNSFGQWVAVTQIQLAAAYSALVNWWTYIQPSIISHIRKKYENSNEITIQEPAIKTKRQIFRPEVSEEMRNALFAVIDTNEEYKLAKVTWYRLWAKSWTSQIAYKWKYKAWAWWTQATFAWVVSIDDPQYIVLIWVSRPRTSQWWVSTAWRIFNEIATFLIWYSMIE